MHAARSPPSIQGQLLRVSEHRAVAIYLREGTTWVADFVDGQGVLIDVNTWFRFNCGSLANPYVSRRIALESALPLPEELVVKIEALHHENQPPTPRKTPPWMSAIFALLPRSRWRCWRRAIPRAEGCRVPLVGTCTDIVQRPGDIMHSKERQQLVEFYSREARRSLAPPERGSNKSASLLALMLKCAACVAVVTLLVVIGNGEYKVGIGAGGGSDPARQATTVNTSSRTAADRKELFDARRARFEGHDTLPGGRIAAAAVQGDAASAEGSGGATCSGGVNGGMDASGSECNAPPTTRR